MTIKRIVLFFFFLNFFIVSRGQTPVKYYTDISPNDTEEQIIFKAANLVPTDRQFTWQQYELTAFLHFGINTFTDREWGDGKENPELFNPELLDAEQWVKTLKSAGFKLVILTAKHHDGFCLWPSKFTEHSVKNSPWKNGKGDVVKELSEACRKYNMDLGIYLSPWDRNSNLYGTDAYNDYFVNQLTELLTQYGKIDEVWFDGANGEGPNGKKQVYDFERWYSLIRQLQPNAVIAVMGPDVRWVGTETGIGRLTEWSVIPAKARSQQDISESSQSESTFKPEGDMTDENLGSRDRIRKAEALVWYPAETDVSIRPGWFFHEKENEKVKTPSQLMDIYFSSVGRNGVLLLNIPPNRKGLIQYEDSLNLMQWKDIRAKAFKTNLASKSKIVVNSGKGRNALADNKYNTYWTTGSERDTSALITFTFRKTETFNIVALQENIRVGQRIEKFKIEYWDGQKWELATEGTTVGYKRLLKFPAVTAKKVRINIISSRLNPTLSEVGFYNHDWE